MPRRNSGARLRYIARSKCYYIVWTEAGRDRQRSTGAGELREANLALARFLKEHQAKDGPRDPAEIMITDVLIDYARERGPEMRSADRVGYAGKALAPLWAGKTVGQVTKESCRAYCRARGVSNGTLRRELGVLAAAINHAHAEGRLSRKVTVWRPERPEARDRWLSRSEAARLIIAARWRMPRSLSSTSRGYRPCYLPLFVLIGLYTGRRKEAILSLRWPQIDLAKESIDFRCGPETKKKRGKVPIGPKLLGHLRRARKRGTDLGYVIADRDGNRMGDVKKGFAAAVRRAGLGKDVTPHVLKELVQRG
jgi:integrase